ncbi:MAG: pyruvate kinase [Cyanobium sp.]
MSLLGDLRKLREDMVAMERQEAHTLASITAPFGLSARNLLHFIAFHRSDHPGLVSALRERGLSSLESCDGHLAASLGAVIDVLEQLEDQPPVPTQRPDGPSHRQSLELLAHHSQALFGSSAQSGARVIMVTLPADAAQHPTLIHELVEAGMGIARINCAHDGPAIWGRCIEKVRQANEATGRSCRVAMDLAGPKLRTGPLPPEPGVVDARPQRDRYGRLLSPARLLAAPLESSVPHRAESPLSEGETLLPIVQEGWAQLEPGHRLRGRDASGRFRELQVMDISPLGIRLRCHQRSRFTTGLRFVQEGGEGFVEIAELPPIPGERVVHVGECLRLTAAITDAPDAIPCSCPEVFPSLNVGEIVVFDEGRIQAVIEDATSEQLVLRITQARARGARLRADKGINLPGSVLSIPALTAKDLQDLEFAADHADILNFSFVHEEADIDGLHHLLASRGRSHVALVLKIETRRAFLNLPRLLLSAMGHSSPLGVMIARGDLAVECGWEALAEIQEEMLHLCASAHVPCIWATQVLDTMVRHGTPTRAEITDAAMGARADALMLNKGPNITATVQTLRTIAACMETHLPEHRRHRDQWLSCLAFSAV